MKFCSKCGKELVDEAIVCPNCGCAVVETSVPKEVSNDQINVGYCVCAALLPIVGIIYWIVKRKQFPKKAQACGITGLCAWIGWILIFSFIGMI